MASDSAALQEAISSALVSVTRSTSQLASEDIAFHRSLDPRFATLLDHQNARLLGLATSLLESATTHTPTVRAPSLTSADAVDNNWRAVVDVVDSLLERADTAIDEFTGAVKRPTQAAEAEAAGLKRSRAPRYDLTQGRVQIIEKPQLSFEHPPSNQETEPFKPLLQSKPHAAVPLEAEPKVLSGESRPQYSHPYGHEIEQYQYPSSVYTYSDPISYHPFESTKAIFVETEESLHEMLQELKQAKEIAVDLEHHDQRSYIGIVSLMQISTRDQDWIVDTLKPWRRRLQCLNEVFADPNIVKVLHGAYMDIVWLQRDLGLYLVGLFDTHYAARALGYAGGSLAFLLKKFASVDAQKQYQTADWRVRPLPQHLLDYARSDTHYLLYIYDCMRNELIEKSNLAAPNHEEDKIWHVLERSNEIALQRYEHPIYDYDAGSGPMGWYRLLTRTPVSLTKEQFAVFRAVHQWRDEVAREQDDSVNWIMPNHQVLTLAKEMPTARVALLRTAQPTSQTVHLRADELVSVIFKAKESGLDGPEMAEVLATIEPRFPRKFSTTREAAHSVAAFVPKAWAPANGSISSLPLRSVTSAFWGRALNKIGLQQQRRTASTLPDVALTVPLPPLTAKVFADEPDVASATDLPGSHPEPESAPAGDDVDEDVMVLGNLRRKAGKRKRSPDGMAAQSDEITVPDDSAELARERAAKKQAKKEAKRAAQRARDVAEGRTVEEAPFDYASAPSILNPCDEGEREGRDKGSGKKKRKEANPYAKVLDTPRGLPRAQKEKAGKSLTYR